MFYLQTFLDLELGFCGGGKSLECGSNFCLRAARPWARHVASLNFHLLICELRTRVTHLDGFQVCDPEPVNSAFYFILFYYTQHAFWGEG